MERDDKSKSQIKEEFKYAFTEDLENDEDYEKALEKDIETNCEIGVYINHLEIEDKPDCELLRMEKEDIIDFKNYQIQKLKAYIFSLEREKEDLIENFKNTTNVLLEKIKENEFKESGMRPETPFIAKKLKTNRMDSNKNALNNDKTQTSSNRNSNNSPFSYKTDAIQRCPNCTKEFAAEVFLQHSLDCLRNKIRCKKCNELIDEKNKKTHLMDWRSKEKIEEALSQRDHKMLQKCLDHGLSPNKITDDNTGNTLLHEISKLNDLKLLEVIMSTELSINPANKNQETPLVVAINEGNTRIVKFLIDMGADIGKRNAADMSPLMIACQKGLREVVKYLVQNKADINEKASISGMTPLTCCKDEELSLYLIQSGARLLTRPSSVKK